MSITLNMPPELESKLAAEAARHGLPLAEYLVRLVSNGTRSTIAVRNGAELVDYWQREGIAGARTDIADSQAHARELRAKAERRERP